MKVLVADDDVIARSVLTDLLTKWDYEPVVAEDGAQAMDILEKETPGLALIDWNMPKMDGLEVTRKTRDGNHSHLPYLIMLTARGEKPDIVKGLDAGANDYVTKPYDQDELRARLEVGKRMVLLQMAFVERMEELETAMEHVKTLHGILPICSGCKKIRDERGRWKHVETYIRDHSGARFSHGLCPACMEELYLKP